MHSLLLLVWATLAERASALRFAVCMTGQVRTLDYEPVLLNIKSMLIDSLPGKVDLFAVFDFLQDPSRAVRLAERLGALNTTFLRTEPPKYGDECTWKGGGPGADAFYVQSAKIAACFERVRAHELERGFTYDYVVRTRPDLGFYAPIRTWLRLSPSAIYTGLNHDDEVCGNQQDFFAVVPAKLTHAYRTLHHLVQNCSRPTDAFLCGHLCPPPGGWVVGRKSDFGPECFLGTQMALHGGEPFGCFDKWVDDSPWEWGAPRQQNLWTIVRRACKEADGAWKMVYGDSACSGEAVPYDQFLLRPFTGLTVTGLPRSPKHPQNPLCGERNSYEAV